NDAEVQIHRNWIMQNMDKMPALMLDRLRVLGPKKFANLVWYATKKMFVTTME
ncbi:TPA: hypothetical protein H1009_04305, partial [archaeon]|nr:hypothetical protein [Candidatus Naiadarchaeales archaeon SRR2090153.bin461]